MNAILSATIPLPAILDRPSRNGPGRRHRIDDFELSTAAVDRFNDLLARLGRRTAPLDRDRIATAARELRDGAANDDAPPLCIRQRIQRLEAAARMIGEAGWEPADEAGNTAAVIVRYARSSHHVLPPTLPKVGRLDEAIVVDAAWPALAAEVANFLDFCRLREIEAELRGCDANAFSFTRANWEQARRAEAILAVQRRCIREGSYLPALTPRFVVH